MGAFASPGRRCRVVSSGNMTDEAWAEHIKSQVAPEPDDDFHVARVRRTADRSGFEPWSEATTYSWRRVHHADVSPFATPIKTQPREDRSHRKRLITPWFHSNSKVGDFDNGELHG